MEINRMIDHTILKPEATEDQIRKLCEEAKEYHFYSCCVNGEYTALVHSLLEGSNVKTCTVVGFPLGAMSTRAKVAETEIALEDGADEIDMVIAVGQLKAGNYDYVKNEIAALKKACGPDRVLKVIIETCLLTDDEKRKACELAVEAGADYVKTSTGFSTGGATVHDVRLMKETVKDHALVKASGGIHTAEEAQAMVEAGASRIGASAGVRIMQELA
ncbi:MAG: deoxyribose-phosphate aldolase [Peptoniphilaceae bacterium]|nr:deoxyribose-phosphate aldolase [Peptoniphilaceae bacterium]MCI6660448.1 deoxyribose-phosphate aldolase [Peptoniphilaceae bacterium]MDD7433534.1 deoxyribose-phosphate aldolase [Peptoniphilaceae bacterium]MDY3076284.1 deoxyribose-phosphate aldolase [Peptoniphilaceae bacterium]MDY3986308.1 deoxyribose-phosphate aldolase [Peptoniphilaceae bacterium]